MLVTVAGAFLYQLWFQEHVEGLRQNLKAKRSGERRRRYVRVFVGAVRGEADVTPLRILGQMNLFLLLVPVTVFCMINGATLGARSAINKREVQLAEQVQQAKDFSTLDEEKAQQEEVSADELAGPAKAVDKKPQRKPTPEAIEKQYSDFAEFVRYANPVCLAVAIISFALAVTFQVWIVHAQFVANHEWSTKGDSRLSLGVSQIAYKDWLQRLSLLS